MNRMRWGILLLCLFLIMPAFAATTDPSVIVTGTELTPSVLMPGDSGIITVTLKNTATASSRTTATSEGTAGVTSTIDTTTRIDVNPKIRSVYLDGKGDITVNGGNDQFSGDLGPGQSIDLSFLITAPEKSGIYFPILHVGVQGAENLIYPIPVNVNLPVSVIKQPMLLISQPTLPTVTPGNETTVTVSVTNQGASAADDIAIRVLEEMPSIAPSRTSAFHFSRLGPEESGLLNVSFITDRSLVTGVTEIPLQITYNTVDGATITQTEGLSLDVLGHAEISIASLKTDPVRVDTKNPFDLTIRLENTGTGDARSTMATIDLFISGTKEAFIGKIKPGNDAPAVFSLDAPKEAGNLNYTLTVTYDDDLGTQVTTEKLILSVRSADNSATFTGIFLLLILGAGAGWYFLIYKKKQLKDTTQDAH